MKVGITGATGCVGRNLVERLAIDCSINVIALGRNPSIGTELESSRCVFRRVELTDKVQIERSLKNLDVLVHCAAVTGPWGSYDHFYSANVNGTRNVLAALKQSSVKTFIYLSTPSIYFNNTSRLNIRESEALPLRQYTNYSRTKLEAEHLVRETHLDQCKVFILRPRAIFGAYDRTIMPRLLRVARFGWFPLIEGGDAQVDITYVQNLSELIYQICLDGSARPGTYNITNGEPLTIKELCKDLFSQLGLSPKYLNVSRSVAYHTANAMENLFSLPFVRNYEPPLTKYTVGLIGYSQTLDITLARKCINYQPNISIKEGLSRYVHWLQKTEA